MIVDHIDKTMSIKKVNYGPALSGKTTSIKTLYYLFVNVEYIWTIDDNRK